MWLKILLIVVGIPILVLPITSKIKNKNLTISGYIFLICILIFTFLQILNESSNNTKEVKAEIEKKGIKSKVDSLKESSQNLTDSIDKLKKILLSIDSQFNKANYKIFQINHVNDSLKKLDLLADRPLFHLVSSHLVKESTAEHQYMIETIFANEGKRAATNVWGKSFIIIGFEKPEIFENGSLHISLTNVFPDQSGFNEHLPMMFNPDSTNTDKQIYLYFDIKYSDIVLKTQYIYEIAVKLISLKTGKYNDELVMCRDWEQVHLKNLILKR